MIYGKNMVTFLLKNRYSNNPIIQKLIKETTNENIFLNDMLYIDIDVDFENKTFITYFNKHHVMYPELTPFSGNYLNEYALKNSKKQFIKSGKFANLLKLRNLSNEDIEEFSGLININKKYNIEIVSSIHDIEKYYYSNSYNNPKKGTLWGSCMRHGSNIINEMLKLYVDSNVKLVIVKDEINEKIISRALLWDNITIHYTNNKGKKVTETNKTFLDRIYTISTKDEFILKDFAKENNYIRKYKQSYDYKKEVILPDDFNCVAIMERPMNTKSKKYPYIDTFTYSEKFNEGDDNVLFTNNKINSWYYFKDYDGGCRKKIILEKVHSNYHGNDFDIRTVIYSIVMEDYILRDESVEFGDNDVCHINEIIKFDNIIYYKKDKANIVYSFIYNEYILKKNVLTCLYKNKRCYVKIEDAIWDNNSETYIYNKEFININKGIVIEKKVIQAIPSIF